MSKKKTDQTKQQRHIQEMGECRTDTHGVRKTEKTYSESAAGEGQQS